MATTTTTTTKTTRTRTVRADLQLKSLFYYNRYNNYTQAALTDTLLYKLVSSKKNGHFYYAQAEFFLRRINIYRPLPIFVIHGKDIPEALASELKSLGEKECEKLITNVVRRIYQSIDEEYYHTSGIRGKIKWLIMEEEEDND